MLATYLSQACASPAPCRRTCCDIEGWAGYQDSRHGDGYSSATPALGRNDRYTGDSLMDVYPHSGDKIENANQYFDHWFQVFYQDLLAINIYQQIDNSI